MKKLIAFFVFSLCVGLGTAGPVDAEFETMMDHYFRIQKVLTQDSTSGIDAEAAKIVKLASSATSSDAEVSNLLADLKAAGEKIQGKDLKAARDEFFAMSKPVLIYLNKHYSGDESYFRYFCGMAKKGWVQGEKGIRNPYYGSEMLTCGELIG